MTRQTIVLKQVHLRSALAFVLICSAATLTALLFRDTPDLAVSNPAALWASLLGILIIVGVLLPLIGAIGGLAPLHARRTPVVFLLPAFVLAIFLDARFNAFPVQLFCILGIAAGILGTIVTLFDALESRQTTGPARSRLTE